MLGGAGGGKGNIKQGLLVLIGADTGVGVGMDIKVVPCRCSTTPLKLKFIISLEAPLSESCPVPLLTLSFTPTPACLSAVACWLIGNRRECRQLGGSQAVTFLMVMPAVSC